MLRSRKNFRTGSKNCKTSANCLRIFRGFQEIVLSHWEFAFPKLVMLADDYYDRKQYKQAIEMFNVCKELVRHFKFSSYRTHLIKAFKHYEMICLVQVIIAEMHEKVELARILMGSNRTQEALSILNEANSLEAKIPTLFRDKKRLKDLHYRMNQLREDSYK